MLEIAYGRGLPNALVIESNFQPAFLSSFLATQCAGVGEPRVPTTAVFAVQEFQVLSVKKMERQCAPQL